MLDRMILVNTLGLSCVEKHFLAWLNEYYEIKKLYSNSFISLKQLFKDFAYGATYANYNMIPRLQDLAEEYGIVKHEFISCKTDDAIKKISTVKDSDLCLVRTNTRFFVNFKRSSWREDHFLRVDSAMNWLNDYPLKEGKFDLTEFALVFDGALSIYTLENPKVETIDENFRAIIEQDFTSIMNLGIFKMLDVIGILRLTRRRLFEYYKNKQNVIQILSEEIKFLDKMYLDLRRQILRKEISPIPDKVIVQLINYEKKFAEEILCLHQK